MNCPTIGLLPLYLELYDRSLPEVRPRMEAFRQTIESEFEKRGLQVVTAPVCRLKDEFESAIGCFEEADVDAIVTLHLAYSPSLESAPALARTRLPVIVLDTTPTYSYGPRQDPDELMYNHGIHGVQDLCSVLIREGKPFAIETGHWENSDVLDRVAAWARAAMAASRMRSARVGLIGVPFEGMGDFAVEREALRRNIGIEVVDARPDQLRSMLASVTEDELKAEAARDAARFTMKGVDPDAYARSLRAGLAVRKWIETERLTAFTMNFLSFDRSSGLDTVPFLEASKAMARGIGYAGEGDVLTAAFVGALAAVYSGTTFTEMFCPDWENDSIYLSHMGEMNVDLAADRPALVEKPFPWTDAQDPVIAVGRLAGGAAVYADLAPGSGDTFSLIAAPVEVLEVQGEDRMADSVRGWFRPRMPISDFLARYSATGGTHHSALVYGVDVSEIARFGELMGWNVIVLDGVENRTFGG